MIPSRFPLTKTSMSIYVNRRHNVLLLNPCNSISTHTLSIGLMSWNIVFIFIFTSQCASTNMYVIHDVSTYFIFKKDIILVNHKIIFYLLHRIFIFVCVLRIVSCILIK